MENNQYHYTLHYQPHVDLEPYQPTHESVPTATTNAMLHSDYLMVNNCSHISNCSSSPSSSLLSPYPLNPDSSCSTCPTDYLGLPAFDTKQETSPFASPLSSSSSSSLDMVTHPSAEDFCVSDLLDSYSHHQHITSPTLTDTTMTTNTSYPTYFSQPPMHPHRGISPNTEYWISPETPLMESMDGYMTTNSINTVDQQPYFFVKQQNITVPALLTTSSAFISTTGNPMNHHNTELSVALSYNTKKKIKKMHHCPHCHHTSNRANNMKEHILTHDPYRPKLFTCNVCQKSFARKHDMKRHTKSHLRVPRKQSKSSQQHRHHHQHYQD